jgi:hypothetical protein
LVGRVLGRCDSRPGTGQNGCWTLAAPESVKLGRESQRDLELEPPLVDRATDDLLRLLDAIADRVPVDAEPASGTGGPSGPDGRSRTRWCRGCSPQASVDFQRGTGRRRPGGDEGQRAVGLVAAQARQVDSEEMPNLSHYRREHFLWRGAARHQRRDPGAAPPAPRPADLGGKARHRPPSVPLLGLPVVDHPM